MNYFRTMLLLAAMTALFMGVGYLIGGTGGMLLALVFAIGTNAVAFWNSDKMVLRMHGAEPVVGGGVEDGGPGALGDDALVVAEAGGGRGDEDAFEDGLCPASAGDGLDAASGPVGAEAMI